MKHVLMLDHLVPELGSRTGLVYGLEHVTNGVRRRLLVSFDRREGLVPIATTSDGASHLPKLLHIEGDGWCLLAQGRVTTCETVPWSEAYRARAEGIVDAKALRRRRVAFIGCSSVGAPVAVSLGKVGVNVVLFDPEDVALENLIRSSFLARHVGEAKVEALRELLLDANPTVDVRTFCSELHAVLAYDPEALDDVDLIVNAASNAVGFELAARFHRSVPVLYPGVHARGASAELFVSLGAREPNAACFACFRARVPVPASAARTWNYGAEGGELAAEPALGSDIGHLTAITSSVALRILAGKADDVLPENRRLLLLSNKKGSLLEHAFESRWVEVPRDPQCPFHRDEVTDSSVDPDLLASIPEVEP